MERDNTLFPIQFQIEVEKVSKILPGYKRATKE